MTHRSRSEFDGFHILLSLGPLEYVPSVASMRVCDFTRLPRSMCCPPGASHQQGRGKLSPLPRATDISGLPRWLVRIHRLVKFPRFGLSDVYFITAHCSDCTAWSALGEQLIVDTRNPALLNVACMILHQQCRRAWFPAPADARRQDKAERGG